MIASFTLAQSSEFLSTLSLRRATAKLADQNGQSQYFYPRSPCGERPGTSLGLATAAVISIHALLAESDEDKIRRIKMRLKFLSTLSLRRATVSVQNTVDVGVISIHALLAESDKRKQPIGQEEKNFYPRSPCGERPLRKSKSRSNW